MQHSSTSIGVVALGGCTIASTGGRTLRLKQRARLKQKELGWNYNVTTRYAIGFRYCVHYFTANLIIDQWPFILLPIALRFWIDVCGNLFYK